MIILKGSKKGLLKTEIGTTHTKQSFLKMMLALKTRKIDEIEFDDGEGTWILERKDLFGKSF